MGGIWDFEIIKAAHTLYLCKSQSLQDDRMKSCDCLCDLEEPAHMQYRDRLPKFCDQDSKKIELENGNLGGFTPIKRETKIEMMKK